HGYAWMATYVEALRQLRNWARGLDRDGALTEREALILQIGFGEYLAQLQGGIALSQTEIARPADLGLDAEDLAPLDGRDAATLCRSGNTEAARARLAELLGDALDGAGFGAVATGDEALEMVRDQFRRFAVERVAPLAQDWHLRDELIPLE